jgi:ubiquitin C-terminal hydrolase
VTVAFDSFDSDHDGKLSRDEFEHLLDSISKVGKLHLNLKRTIKESSGQDEKFMQGPASPSNTAVPLLEKSVSMMVDHAFQKYDSNHDGLLEYPDYVTYMTDNPSGLEFLDRIKQFVSLQMGLPPSSGLEERAIILELREQSTMKVGDTYYLLCARWFRKWCQYAFVDPVKFAPLGDEKELDAVENENLKPGKIDNIRLLKEKSNSELQQNLQETEDFLVLSERVWSALFSWYGGGPIISRQAIPAGKGPAQTILVELYPMSFVLKVRNHPNMFTYSISRSCTLHFFRDRVCSTLKINPDDVVIWDVFNEEEPRLLEDVTQTIEDCKLAEGQKLYFDVRLENGKFIGFKTETKDQEEEEEEELKTAKEGPVGDSHGLVGLYNLGNTCFMNSAIQCLSLTGLLSQYFLKDLYMWELNQENPLGMDGRVALSYGNLIKKIHTQSSKFSAVAPRGMKWTIGKFAPQFVGFQQHDAQELLQFLLDGLHEGLNRVREKPYIEIQDSNKRPDEEVAAEQWDAFLKRNQSIVVEIFMGQLKSTLRWSCGRENVKFDPYSVLSLPLPKPDQRYIDIIVVFQESTRIPTRFSVQVRPNQSVADMRVDLAELAAVPAKKLCLVELFNSTIYSSLSLYSNVEGIRSTDVIYAYEVPPEAPPNPKEPEEEEKKTTEPIKIDFHVGATFDCLDRWNKWYNAKVLEEKETQVFVHYEGWPEKYDEWVDKKSDRIQPLNSRAVPKDALLSRTKFEGLNVDPNWISVHFCHRYLEPQEDYFLNPMKPRLFGIPIILFIDPKTTTWEKLYQMVWAKVQRFAPAPAETDTEASPPFVLSRVKRGGYQCSQCSWVKLCLGCKVELSKEITNLSHNDSIAIDWNFVFYEKYLGLKEMKEIWDHDSVNKYKAFLQRRIDFQDCMAQFTKKEVMDGDSAPYCSDCKEMHSAAKTLEPFSTPPVLIIHLKRLVQGIKIGTFVDFPLRAFDPRPFLGRNTDGKEPELYDLYAVVNHFGSSGAGHYVTYGFVPEEDSWFCFDDSRVSKLDEKDVCSKNAYMLFYLRRGVQFQDVIPLELRDKIDADLTAEMKSLLNSEEQEPSMLADLCPWMSKMPAIKLPLLGGNKQECVIT